MSKFEKIKNRKAAESPHFETDFGIRPYDIFNPVDVSSEVFNVDASVISDNFFFPLRTHPESDTEHKFKQVHEELADIRKYAKGLEEMVVSLTTVVTSLMHDRNRMKKQIKDQSDEFDEWFKKHGEALIYVRNKIIEAKKETMAIQEQHKNQQMDKFLKTK